MNNENQNDSAHWVHDQDPHEPQPIDQGAIDPCADGTTTNYVLLDEEIADAEADPIPTPRIQILRRNVYEPVQISPNEREQLRNQHGSAPQLLLFDPQACQKLKGCIDWGYKTRQNRVEQGGILIGRVYRFEDEIFSYVEECICANTKGSEVLVEFTPDLWSEMQLELDGLNRQKSQDEQMAIIGWFHTHPNSLPVFMSGTDQMTQEKNFSQDWQVSVVLNPHRMKLRAFFGKKLRNGKIIGWENTPLGREQPPSSIADRDARDGSYPCTITQQSEEEIDEQSPPSSPDSSEIVQCEPQSEGNTENCPKRIVKRLLSNWREAHIRSTKKVKSSP